MRNKELKELKKKSKENLKLLNQTYKQFKKGDITYQEAKVVYDKVGLEIDTEFELLHDINNEYREE